MKKKRMAALLAVLAITLPMLFASCRENGGDGKDTDVSSGSVSGSESGADTNETDKLPNGIPDKTYNGTSIRMITAPRSETELTSELRMTRRWTRLRKRFTRETVLSKICLT